MERKYVKTFEQFVNEGSSDMDKLVDIIEKTYNIKAVNYTSNVIAYPNISPGDSLGTHNSASIQFISADVVIQFLVPVDKKEFHALARKYDFKRNAWFGQGIQYTRNSSSYEPMKTEDIKTIIKLILKAWEEARDAEKAYYTKRK